MGHEVGVTAIQLAMAYCAIANGGYLLKPKLIRQVINDENLPVFTEKPIIVRKIADEKTMRERVANEIIDAFNNKGNAVKKREETHKMADANRAFSHFRW